MTIEYAAFGDYAVGAMAGSLNLFPRGRCRPDWGSDGWATVPSRSQDVCPNMGKSMHDERTHDCLAEFDLRSLPGESVGPECGADGVLPISVAVGVGGL